MLHVFKIYKVYLTSSKENNFEENNHVLIIYVLLPAKLHSIKSMIPIN